MSMSNQESHCVDVSGGLGCKQGAKCEEAAVMSPLLATCFARMHTIIIHMMFFGPRDVFIIVPQGGFWRLAT